MESTTIRITKNVGDEFRMLKKYSGSFNGVIGRLPEKYGEKDSEIREGNGDD